MRKKASRTQKQEWGPEEVRLLLSAQLESKTQAFKPQLDTQHRTEKVQTGFCGKA
jgi:hypothetical protein